MRSNFREEEMENLFLVIFFCVLNKRKKFEIAAKLRLRPVDVNPKPFVLILTFSLSKCGNVCNFVTKFIIV